MEAFADFQRAETEAKLWSGAGKKRIRGRFRATFAGLLELEVLRVRHKEMVQTALGKCERPDRTVNPDLQERHHQYWVEESSFRLKLKRSLSQENVAVTEKTGTFPNWRRTSSSQSSDDLQHLYCPGQTSLPEYEDRCSRASSGFCESDFGDVYSCADDAVSFLSTSLASLSYRSTLSDAGYGGHNSTVQRRPVLLKSRADGGRKTGTEAQTPTEKAIPEAGFFSVVDLYPDSHWPDISDILQPQVVLEPSYRCDLRSHQGSEVYHYPSPLHAVALQSPLYAPQSPTKPRKRTGRYALGGSTLNSRVFPRPDPVPKQSGLANSRCHSESTSMLQSSMSLPRLQSSWMSKHDHFENCRCMEIILKRAHGQLWSHSSAKSHDEIHTWSRRSMVSLHRTCSMGKSGASSSFKSKHFQNKGTGESASEPATSTGPGHTGFRGRLGTHKNHPRRHTAALTNLDIFRECRGTAVPCGAFLDRCCSIRVSNERNTLYRGHSSQLSMVDR